MKAGLIVKQVIGTLVFFAIIFISAGRLMYWQGLVYVILGLFMFFLGQTVFALDDDLLKERSKPGEGVKSWDKVILGLSFLSTIAMYLTGGLDSGRFHWSPEFHWSVNAAGFVLTMAGQLLFLIAQKQNRFFSSTVRIQSDRGHSVCDTGLYKFVRHPAYFGSVIQAIGFPMLFGSYWSIIPVAVSIILFIIRTALEDKTLIAELNGYKEYTGKTKYRLFPYLW
jgi:protein-S-isoprenylcysteine O-methyltransferase Ste14